MRATAKLFPVSNLVLAVALLFGVTAWAQTAAEGAVVQAAPAGQTAGQAAQSSMSQATADTSGQQPAPTQIAAPSASASEMQSSAPLRVMVNKSLLITTTERLKRVSVTDPSVADAMVVTPTQVLVHGRAPGEVSLILWDEQERSRSFDLRVDVDVTALQQDIDHLFPDEHIQIEPSRNAVVLNGHVATKEDADRAGAVAGAFSKNVVNVLTFGPVGAQEVLLEVKFAEVQRTAITQWGFNLFSTGAAGNIGATGTGQFSPFTGANVGSIPVNAKQPGAITGSAIASGYANSPLTGSPASFATNSLMNLFLFRSDINLGAIVTALQEKNILQVLAEPNLIAVNGRESSFLAGGEFPYPVVSSSQGLQSITIVFKEYGIKLKFTPLIMPNGNIHLHVAPEVSALDYTNAVTISGFVLPAISTRRAESELELQDGQSFVIAGLLDNNLTDFGQKIPGLGDIPILGKLFSSKNKNNQSDELMVLITAHRISPASSPAPLPKFPEPFLTPPETTPVPGTGTEKPSAAIQPASSSDSQTVTVAAASSAAK
ncbi:MAG: pilus assembly protein N-terminal domain-containing protein [Terriglobales bacterium]